MSEETLNIINSETPILIVDDNVQFANLLKRILQGAFGYKDITMLEDSEAAFSLISSDPQKFKLLFIDFNFPSGTTGGELLTRLAAESLLKDKAAFLITSEPSSENVNQAKKAGAVGVVAKPFDRQELQRQIERADRQLQVDQGEYF